MRGVSAGTEQFLCPGECALIVPYGRRSESRGVAQNNGRVRSTAMPGRKKAEKVNLRGRSRFLKNEFPACVHIAVDAERIVLF